MAFAAITLSSPHARAQDWVEQFGTFITENLYGMTPDGSGGVVATGTWFGVTDAFVTRYNSSGVRLWLTLFGGPDADQGRAVAPDGSGGFVVVGGRKPCGGCPVYDGFVARFDGTGTALWTSLIVTTGGGEVFAYSVAHNGESGDSMVAGQTGGILGTGTYHGNGDGFLARYDIAGNQLWVEMFGTTTVDRARAVVSVGDGGAIVAGETLGNLGGPSAGSLDAFLARYDSAGNQLWMRQFGSSNADRAWALAPDSAGGVMVAGATTGSLAGPNFGSWDAFVARYDGAGNQLWIRQFGSTSVDWATALAPDGNGGVFVSGYTGGSLGGVATGSRDVFQAHYDSAGNQTWIRQFGTVQEDRGYAVASDGATGVFVGGETAGVLGSANAGLLDAFIGKFSSSPCYPDCDNSGVLDLFDFLCWQNAFVASAPFACNCDTSTGPNVCDIFDFLCFQNAFVSGCP